MRIEGHVGPAITLDGQEGIPFRQGRLADLIVTELHGKYYEQCSRGNCYYANSVTAGQVVLAAATNPSVGFHTLFNPAGSNVNVSIIRFMLTYLSGTTAFGGLTWNYTYNAGSQAATGSPITVFTTAATVNALVGSPNVAKCLWSPALTATATNAYTTAPTVFAGTGIGMTANTSGSLNNPYPIIIDYDGMFVIAPGTAVSLCNANATTTALFSASLLWEEIPI